MKLILIRHSLTDYNLKKRYCGFKDIGLNKTGRLQAKKIKLKLNGFKIDKVFCSDLKRSIQTTKIIFANAKCPIITSPNLREINFGKLEGLTYKQALKKFPTIYKQWLKNPFMVNIPEGEKIGRFSKRIKAQIKDIFKKNSDKTIAIVSHFGPIRIILNNALGIDRKKFWQMKLKSQAVYIIDDSTRPKVYTL